MLVDGPAPVVAEHEGRLGQIHRLERGADADATVDDHPDAVHLEHEAPAETAQPGVRLLDAPVGREARTL